MVATEEVRAKAAIYIPNTHAVVSMAGGQKHLPANAMGLGLAGDG